MDELLSAPEFSFDVGTISDVVNFSLDPSAPYSLGTYNVELLSFAGQKLKNVPAVQWGGGIASQGESRYPPRTRVLIGYYGSERKSIILGAIPNMTQLGAMEGKYTDVQPGGLIMGSSMKDDNGVHNRPGARIELDNQGVVRVVSPNNKMAASLEIGRPDGDEDMDRPAIKLGIEYLGIGIDVKPSGEVSITSNSEKRHTSEAHCQVDGSSFEYVTGDSSEYIEGDKIILGKSGSVIQISKDGDILLKDKKGNSISLNSIDNQLTISSGTGKDYLKVEKDEVSISSNQDVIVTALNQLMVVAPEVALGVAAEKGVARLGDYCATFCPLIGQNVAGEIADPTKMPPGPPIPKNAGVGALAPSKTVTAQD